jgi:hypothetical protein
MNRDEQDRTFLVIAGDATKRRAVFTVWSGVERCRSDTGGIGRAEQELDGPGSCGVAKLGDLRREKPDKAADRVGRRVCRNTGRKQNADERKST